MNAARTANPDEQPVALVTGAGRRVGNALARALSAAGYRVALHASGAVGGAEQTARDLSAAGPEAIALAADLRDEAATRRMIRTARDHFGRIDALVNNAAIWVAKPLEQTTADDVRRHFEVNLLGTFVCCQEAGLIMVAQSQGGAIVNIGDWATRRPYINYAAYFAAKGSIPTLTRTFALELGSRNPRVRVNAILPGPVLPPQGMTADELRELARSTLVKREGSPADLAQAVLMLIENTFVSGVCLPVDGGRTIYCPQ